MESSCISSTTPLLRKKKYKSITWLRRKWAIFSFEFVAHQARPDPAIRETHNARFHLICYWFSFSRFDRVLVH